MIYVCFSTTTWPFSGSFNDAPVNLPRNPSNGVGVLVSHAWLREWVATKTGVHELAERLTLGGLEVESVASAGPSLHKKRVIIGRITRSDPHPGAARLRVCEVDIGKRARLTIVCGAANALAGGTVPVATAGAKLPGLEVQTRTIAGVESAGMICSAAELGLEENSAGVMLLDEDAPIGASVGEYLDLSDSVMEIELTPNRGDCLGILGIAREVCALTGAKMRAPVSPVSGKRAVDTIDKAVAKMEKVRNLSKARLPVKLRAPRGCPRYVGRAVRNINMEARTPDWMSERLRRGGVRSLNVVVDVTNYVMLELGQPMHAFDMDKLAGGIVVRMANPGEKLKLLDGRTVKLRGDNLIIADHKKAVALAGIMGGQNSAISAATRHIYFEAAFFPAPTIIGKARKLGMHTDASHRFERGVDPTIQAHAIERATRLLVTLAGGEPGPVSDARARNFIPRPVNIRFNRAEIGRILGASVPANTVRALLQSLGMRVVPNKAGWKVTVPGWRTDITGPHDLVEEVGRVRGFDHIAAHPPTATATVGAHPESRIETARIKQKLVERGYFEAITYSFVDPQIQRALTGESGIPLRNPIADNMAAMRRSLWPGLLEAVRLNLNRQHARVRLFETGHVFLKGRADGGKGRARKEIHRLAAVATGSVLPKQWGAPSRAIDFFDLKGDLAALLALSAHCGEVEFAPAVHSALHPGRSAQIKLRTTGGDRDGVVVGYLGQLHPGHQKLLDIEQPVCLFELDLSLLAEAPLPRVTKVSRYPAVRRDLAVVVESGVEAQDVLDTACAAAGDLLVDLELFDIYEGEGIEKNHKSFAFRLTFQSESSNLTAGEADTKTAQIINALQRQLGARLRT